MKIIVHTVYEDIDDKFVQEYLKELCMNPMLKEAKEDFLAGETIGFRSNDERSPAYGITLYRLIK